MAQPYTIKSGDPRNDVTPAAPKGYSTFDLSHRFLQTHRFGEITPHCSFEFTKGSTDSMRLMNDTSSYSLKSPVKMDMFQKRSNFFVPLGAIIRNNWELITAQPVSGDDAPENADGVVTAAQLNTFLGGLVEQICKISSSEADDSYTISDYLTDLIRNLLIGEMFFSQGSLCKQLLYDFSHCVLAIRTSSGANDKFATFDAFAEHIWSALAPGDDVTKWVKYFEVCWIDEDNNVTDSFMVAPDGYLSDIPALSTLQRISFRHFLDLARQNLNFYIVDDNASYNAKMKLVSSDGYTSLYADAREYLFGDFYISEDADVQLSYRPLTEDINFDRLSAYQLVCAHFFSLDYVDYIYSAELYRQLMQYYFDLCCHDGTSQTFTWNGLELNYDPLSGYAINKCALTGSYRTPFYSHSFDFSVQDSYLVNLFSFRHSLRYLDYFTGGRTQPLSVGTSGDKRANVNVAVDNGNVNSVDMILAQNAARYLNFAQRAGRKISQWLDKLLPGGVPRPDMHDPQWLTTTGDALNPEQVQNTGASQAADANSITARFKADSNQYVFTCSFDRPGYVICVTYYDIPRAYAFATDKENMHCNRYDRFNPFMQYNGSQKVNKQEIGLIGDTPFSYQNRYEEFKQKYDIAAGGFVENLPGFAFIADLQSGIPMQSNLNPTYIRSWNVELDPFYLALTGYGLAAYFHFIVKNVNIIKGVRPMEYAPQLM